MMSVLYIRRKRNNGTEPEPEESEPESEPEVEYQKKIILQIRCYINHFSMIFLDVTFENITCEDTPAVTSD